MNFRLFKTKKAQKARELFRLLELERSPKEARKPGPKPGQNSEKPESLKSPKMPGPKKLYSSQITCVVKTNPTIHQPAFLTILSCIYFD